MRICDWSSVVCSSDLIEALHSACPLQRATNCHRGAGSDRSWFIRSFQKAGSRVAAPFVLILPRRIGCGLGFRRRVEIHAGKVRLQTEAFKESRCLMRVAVAGQLLDGATDEARKLDSVHGQRKVVV